MKCSGQVYLIQAIHERGAAAGRVTCSRSLSFFRSTYSMQNAKDSFYMALRTRLITINPDRTTLLRGAIRPGILVEEAEAPFVSFQAMSSCCVGLALAPMLIRHSSGGRRMRNHLSDLRKQSFGGLDRGRALSAMDKELVEMLQPFYTPKLNYTAQPAGIDVDASILG